LILERLELDPSRPQQHHLIFLLGENATTMNHHVAYPNSAQTLLDKEYIDHEIKTSHLGMAQKILSKFCT
jgi:hypothetical protein